MGLLTILKKIKQKEKEIRILILGLDNAGKTTVVKTLCREPIDTIEPTLGFTIQTLQYHQKGSTTHTGNSGNSGCSNYMYTINLWDVGGQKSIRAYWRNYFERTDGLIWVVDSTDTYRLEQCRDELAQLLQQDKLAGASLLILANKQDVHGAVSESRIAELLQLEALPPNRHWTIVPCSAVTGDGLVEGMDWIIQDIASRVYMLA